MTENSAATELLLPSERRNGTADLLKGLAVLFMIQVHVMEQFCTPELWATLTGKISFFLGGPLCAPIFLVVMGWFIKPDTGKIKHHITRGMWLFSGGILLNIARSAHLIFHVSDNSLKLDPLPFIFGVDILPLAGLSLVMISLLIPVFGKRFYLWLAAAVIIQAISFYPFNFSFSHQISLYSFSYFMGTSDWSYFPVIPWISYIFMGISLRCLTRKPDFPSGFFTETRILWWIIPVTALLLVTFSYAFEITGNLQGENGYYHHGIVFFLWVLMFLSLYFLIIHHWETATGDTPVKRIIRRIGENVTLVYIIQWLVIGNLATVLYRTQELAGFILWSLVVSAGSLMLGYFFLRARQFACQVRNSNSKQNSQKRAS